MCGLSTPETVRAVLKDILELQSNITDAITATNAVRSVCSSAKRASVTGNDLLAAARVRRVENLLEVSTEKKELAERCVRKMMTVLCDLSSNVTASSRANTREATWKSLSESWWLEKVIALRWRLGEVGDCLENIGIFEEAGENIEYEDHVSRYAARWEHLSVVNNELLLEIEKWKDIALAVLEGTIGDHGTLLKLS